MPDLDKILDDAVANPILNEAAEEIGKNLLDAMIGELTLIPHPSVASQNVWSTRKQADQDATINRFKDRVRNEVLRFFRHVMADGNPAATATLEKIVFTDKGIQGTLAIDRNSRERHALADFAGERVLVIMLDDVDAYFESMGEVQGSDDQAQLDLKPNEQIEDESKPDPADDRAPDDADQELAHALSLQGVLVPAAEIATWGPDKLEAAWTWIEETEKAGDEPGPAVPDFLDAYTGPVDENAPTDGTSDGGEEQPAADADSIPAGTETEPEAEPETDHRTVKALIKESMALAAEIGEGDISQNQFKKKGRDGLLDYLKYAREQKAELDADNPEAETAALVTTLAGLTIDVEASVIESWSPEDRTQVEDYAARMSSGKLPKQIPAILAPYLLGGDERPTA